MLINHLTTYCTKILDVRGTSALTVVQYQVVSCNFFPATDHTEIQDLLVSLSNDVRVIVTCKIYSKIKVLS